MSFSKTVLKNTFWVTAGQMTNLVLNFLWVALVARHIGPSQYGIYGYGYSLCAMLILAVNFGFDQLLILHVTKDRRETFPFLKKVLRIKMLLLPLYFAVFAGIGFSRHWGIEWWQIIAMVSCFVAIDAISATFVALFQSHQLMHYDVALQIIGGIWELGGVWYGVHHGMMLHSLLFFNVSASLFRLLMLSLLSRRKLTSFEAASVATVRLGRDLWKEALPLFLISVVSILYSNLIVLVLGWMNRPSDELGVFVAATRLQSYLMLVPATLTTVLLPAFSRLYATSKEEFVSKFQGVVKILYWISIPVSLLACANSEGIVRFVYGSKFLNAAPLLAIQSLMLLSGASYAFGSTMLIIGKQYLTLILYGSTMVAVVVIAVFLVPIFGVQAACWAQFAGVALGIIIYPAILYRHFFIRFPVVFLLKTLIIAGLSVSADLFLLRNGVYFIASGIISMIVMIALSWIVGIFNSPEWNPFRALRRQAVAFIRGAVFNTHS